MSYGLDNDVEDGLIVSSSPTKRKVIKKLQEFLGFDFNECTFSIATFKGAQDADAFRWFTVGLEPQINSSLTMTDFIKNKKTGYAYGGYMCTSGITIDEVGEGYTCPELPSFRSL